MATLKGAEGEGPSKQPWKTVPSLPGYWKTKDKKNCKHCEIFTQVSESFWFCLYMVVKSLSFFKVLQILKLLSVNVSLEPKSE